MAIVGVCIYGVDTLLSLGLKGLKNAAAETTTTTSISDVVDTTAEEDTTAAEDTTAEAETTTQAAE